MNNLENNPVFVGIFGFVFTFVITLIAGGDLVFCLWFSLLEAIIAAAYLAIKNGLANEKEMNRKQAILDEQIAEEKEQKQFAELEGFAKTHEMSVVRARKYREGVEAMRNLGMAMQSSVNLEKEASWSILGGIADGLAGPAAGVATAVDVMQSNAEVRARNEAKLRWGAEQRLHYEMMAIDAEQKSPKVVYVSELEKKYDIISSWSPDEMFSEFQISNIKTEIDKETGAVYVSADYVRDKQSDKQKAKGWIDGALRAKLYTKEGTCAGCAYLVFPEGASRYIKSNFKLSGICATPKPSNSYTVKIEPVDLWEIVPKGDSAKRKNSNLTPEEHRALVAESKARFSAELCKQAVDEFCETFGVSAEASAETTKFYVVITGFGTEKIKVIKEIRGITGLGLAEAKGLVEKVPVAVKEAVSKEDAEALKAQLEAVGASVEIM